MILNFLSIQEALSLDKIHRYFLQMEYGLIRLNYKICFLPMVSELFLFSAEQATVMCYAFIETSSMHFEVWLSRFNVVRPTNIGRFV